MPFDPKTGEHDFGSVLTLELLFRSEADFVMNTARRCGVSDADAEDVAQRVFMALQRRLHTLQSPESVRPWLLTVTRRLAMEIRGARREEDAISPGEIGELEDDEPLAEERIARSEERRQVLDLVEEIEPARRAVFVMYALDELPMREIAEALEIPIGTAYNRLRLARHDLREALRRRHHADEFIAYRRWGELAWVRDPTDYYYGRTAITQETRDRLWTRVLDAIRAAFASIEAAESEGLRIESPMFRRHAPPVPYRIPRRRATKDGAPRAPRRGRVTESRTP